MPTIAAVSYVDASAGVVSRRKKTLQNLKMKTGISERGLVTHNSKKDWAQHGLFIARPWMEYRYTKVI